MKPARAQGRLLQVGDRQYTIFPFDGLGADESVGTLPYCLKLLLENLLRHRQEDFVSSDDIDALLNWDPAAAPGALPAAAHLVVMRVRFAGEDIRGRAHEFNRFGPFTVMILQPALVAAQLFFDFRSCGVEGLVDVVCLGMALEDQALHHVGNDVGGEGAAGAAGMPFVRFFLSSFAGFLIFVCLLVVLGTGLLALFGISADGS